MSYPPHPALYMLVAAALLAPILIGCGSSSSSSNGGSISLDLPELYEGSVDLSLASGFHTPAGAQSPLPVVVTVDAAGGLEMDAESGVSFSINGLMVEGEIGGLEKLSPLLSLGLQLPAEGSSFDYRERLRDLGDDDAAFDEEFATVGWSSGTVRLGDADIPVVIVESIYDDGMELYREAYTTYGGWIWWLSLDTAFPIDFSQYEEVISLTPFLPLNPVAGSAYHFDYNFTHVTIFGNLSGEGRVVWRIADLNATSPNDIDGCIRIEGKSAGSISGTGFFDIDSQVTTSTFTYYFKSGIGEVYERDIDITVSSEGTFEEERIWELVETPSGGV